MIDKRVARAAGTAPTPAMAGVIKKGWMRKRARGVNASIRGKKSNWKERWFELSTEEICYYDKCVPPASVSVPAIWGMARNGGTSTIWSRSRCCPCSRTAHPGTVSKPPSPQATPPTGQPARHPAYTPLS